MSTDRYAAVARKHWAKWLPSKTAALRANGEFTQAVRTAAKLTQEKVLELMQQGYRQHEAEEAAFAEYILLLPEAGAATPAWERDELAALERRYRADMGGADDNTAGAPYYLL
jgi:hypothetical protein